MATTTSDKYPYSSPYRMTRKELENETDDEVRNLLRYELNSAVHHFLGLNISVYLEGLGIIYPTTLSEFRSELKGEQVKVWKESYRSVAFEKTSELISFHKDQFGEIVETKELTQWIYPRLPVFITAKWEEREIRRFLRGTIEGIKREVVTKGRSQELNCVGELLAIHNRQGDTPIEWFAGADIFLEPTYRFTLSTGKPDLFQRPLLMNAWTILEAAYGQPTATSTIEIGKELSKLGYDPTLLPSEEAPSFSVAAFKSDTSGHWIFCTDGLRNLGIRSAHSKGYGNEFVFQLNGKGLEHIPGYTDSPPFHLASSALTIGWMLLKSSKSRTARVGAGLSVEDSPFPPEIVQCRRRAHRSTAQYSDLHTIFVTPFSKVRSEQRSPQGNFTYLNLLAITDDETELAAASSPSFLLTLLEHRSLSQVTSPLRPSLLLRTCIEVASHSTLTNQEPAPITELPLPNEESALAS